MGPEEGGAAPAPAMEVLSVRLPAAVAIAGCELRPVVFVRQEGGGIGAVSLDDDRTAGGGNVPNIGFTWLRSKHPLPQRATQNRKDATLTCTYHPSEPASLQNVTTRTYHCTEDCFREAFRRHRLRVRSASSVAADRSTNNEGRAGGAHAPSNTSGESGESGPLGGWIEVGNLRSYVPSDEDVGHVLKLECAGFTIDTGKVLPMPVTPQRDFRPIPNVPNHVSGKISAHGKFSIVTYNVLADLYANSIEIHGHCPLFARSWPYRRQNLLHELLKYEADILCLQEVQSDHFEEFFAPELAKKGYIAVYKKKTTELYTGSSYAIDGCATFFRRDKFQLVKKYEVEFNKAALSLSEGIMPKESKKQALNRLLKDNVALIVVLEALNLGDADGGKESGKRRLICVSNTHIHANPELNDVKIWQVHTLLKGLEKIAASADIPMLVVGDFNSMPGSAAHSLLTNGRVEPGHIELKNDPLGILQPVTKLTHHLPICSAYSRGPKDILGDYGEPRWTNYSREFKGTLDYIFYTQDSLEPVSLLELSESMYEGPLPNKTWSSDHVALGSEFVYNK